MGYLGEDGLPPTWRQNETVTEVPAQSQVPQKCSESQSCNTGLRLYLLWEASHQVAAQVSTTGVVISTDKGFQYLPGDEGFLNAMAKITRLLEACYLKHLEDCQYNRPSLHFIDALTLLARHIIDEKFCESQHISPDSLNSWFNLPEDTVLLSNHIQAQKSLVYLDSRRHSA